MSAHRNNVEFYASFRIKKYSVLYLICNSTVAFSFNSERYGCCSRIPCRIGNIVDYFRMVRRFRKFIHIVPQITVRKFV